MKYIVLLLSLFITPALWAKAQAPSKIQDPCLESLTAYYEQGTGFDRLISLSHKEAKYLIKEALAEGGEKDRAVMLGYVGKSNVLFYILGWSAVANSGSNIVAADKANCNILGDILYWSEE